MELRSKSILLAGTLGALVANGDPATELGIVPRPREIRISGESTFTLNKKTLIQCDKASLPSAEYLSGILKNATGHKLAVQSQISANSGIRLKVDINLNVKSAQGYTLNSSENTIDITGKSPEGVFYGVQTLLQLLPTEVFGNNADSGVCEWKVPEVEITDEPYFEKIRGLHIDVSRHFLTKEDVLKIIDYIAMHKLNILHFHLTDDQGWRMEIKAYPKLTTIGAMRKGKALFFTQDDLKEIIEYANFRYIKVIPEVDMPGHMRAAIRSYPELRIPKGDSPTSPKVIRIDEKGETFCKQVLREVKDVFGDVPIHIGFDEVNLGAKKKPIYTDEEITDFAKRITGFIKDELKVTPIVWDDAFEKGLHDKEVLVQWWRPGKYAWWKNLEMTMDQKVQKFDQPYILSPGWWTYFDMRNADGFPGARWAGIVSVDKVYKWEPMIDLVDADPSKRSLAQGITACTWSEQIPNLNTWQNRVFPRLAAFSEKCWSQPADIDKSKPAWEVWRDKVLIKKQLERYKSMGLNYWSKDNPELLVNLKDGKTSASNDKLLERFGKDALIGVWESGKISSEEPGEVIFDATEKINANGKYLIIFVYTKGKYRLDIKGIKVVKNDSEMVGEDIHSGYTGSRSNKNTYTFEITDYDKGASYKIKAMICGDKGDDSNGTVYIKKQ